MDGEKKQDLASTNAPPDPPPPYTAVQPVKSINLFTSIRSRPSPRPLISHPRHPLQVLGPDPTHVKCRCGRHVDTTIQQIGHPAGIVLCRCGYTVTSTGASFYSTTPYTLNSAPETPRCSCGAKIPDIRDTKESSACVCGASFYPSGAVERYCSKHGLVSNDARNVRCSCGRFVDTTASYTITHGATKWSNVNLATADYRSRAGYTCFDYALPNGAGRCECGKTVHRDGRVTTQHSSGCCGIRKTQQIMEKGSECSCAWS